MDDKRPLVIVGDGEFAEIAYEYFTHDSPHMVAAFTVETPYLTKDRMYDLPVVPFEDVENRYPPSDYRTFVAITYGQLNRVRQRLYHEAKRKGYQPVSYISSKAFVWRNAVIGENVFIFENNVVQHHCQVGNNVVMWSGNHIGHRSVIRDNCFVCSHVVVSGYCDVGENSFLGVNCSIGDKVTIGRDCVIGAGAVVVKSTEPGKVYTGNREGPSKVDSFTLFKVKEKAA